MDYAIVITLSSNSAYIGDEITINATTGLFNPNIFNNIVTVNGIIAHILAGDRNHLIINIPEGASTGYIQVDTGYANTGYEDYILSNAVLINIKYQIQSESVQLPCRSSSLHGPPC